MSDWRARLWPASRGRIVERLRRGPATVDQLAPLLGMTANGVRAHLATLERDGWIRPAGTRRPAGPGKPAVMFGLTPETEALLSSAYRPLLLAVLEALAAREPAARLEALMREAGRRLSRDLAGQGGSGSLAERAVRLLALLGGVAEVEERRGGLRIVAAGCPVSQAVAITPAACQAVAGLLSGVLGVPVTEACDRTAGARCRFEIARSGPRARKAG